MPFTSHPYPAHPAKVLHLKGADRAIGRQHGEQVGADCTKGMLKFYYDFWLRLKKLPLEGPRWQIPVARSLGYFIDPVLINQLSKRIPAFARERVEGLAEAIGLPPSQVATVMVLPDFFPLLQAYVVRWMPNHFVEVSPPRFGCSSFVASGKHFLHGRNLDFPGVAYWDRYPVLQSFTPENGLRYIGFGSAGVPLGGISGVNEAQISVSLHQHYCRETTLKGTLPFLIAEQILMQAKSLEMALEILRNHRVTTSWAFIITDGKTRKAMVYETHPTASGVRFLEDHDGRLAHSNYYQTSSCQPAEYATTARMNWDNYWRKTRLDTLVREAGHNLTPAQACKIASDHFDPYWGEEKIFNRTVAQIYNIQSFVLDPEKMTLWLGEGDAPIQMGSYQEYDLGKILAGGDGKTGNSHPAYTFKDPTMREAKQAFIYSFISAFAGDYETSLRETDRAASIHYLPEVGLVSGVLKMKLGDLKGGVERLQEARAKIEARAAKANKERMPPEYFEILLFQARACDLAGNRAEAVSRYQELARHPDLEDPLLRRIAASERPYKADRLRRLMMPFSTYVAFD